MINHGGNMKKVLSIIFAIALMFTSNAYATEIYGNGEATTTVVAHVDSQYCVMIPETIVADGTHYYLSASLMDLADGEVVNVYVNGFSEGCSLPMHGGDGAAYAIVESEQTQLSNGAVVATFHNGEMTATNGIFATLQNATRAGDYSGAITFDIQLGQG